MKFRIQATALACASLATITPLSADWRDEIGYTRLQLLAGPELPSAPSQGFTQVEASVTGEPYTFMPDTANPLFDGKAITNKSPTSGSAASWHATLVATNFYGNTSSLITGDCPVDAYFVNSWLGSTFLKTGINNQPTVESRSVQNHSWIGTGSSDSQVEEIDRRLDFAIDRDGFVCAVGANNGNSTILPSLLCQSYHTISVGLTNGGHSAGLTTQDGVGRIKPDIVAPDGLTSYATAMVSSAASLLYAKLPTSPALTVPDRPRVIKALLLASATKEASWANTSSRPLDIRYGAGELNIHHAYHALRAGRTTASNNTLQKTRGWSAETVNGNSTNTYFFTIAADTPPTPFCAALTWHRVVTKSGFNTWSAALANLNLRLHHATEFTVGPPVAESLSTVDNVELVHQAALAPGTYAVVVENTSATATPYAIAWHSLPAVSVAATVATARESDLQAGLVTVSRSGDTTLPLFVPLTVGGSAVSGSHFQALPASVTIPAGQSSATLQVTPVADSIAQGDRSVTVGIAADFASVRDSAQSAVVTIQDKPFDAWRFANFTAAQLVNPLISGDMADPDSDALANLIEYALGLDPEIFSVSPITTSQLDGYQALTVSKNTAATDISWGAEVTGDLQTWQPAEVITNTTTFQVRDSVLMNNASRRFIRLKITRNPGP